MDAAHISARFLCTTRHIRRTARYGTNPGDTPHAVIPPWDNPPVLIGGIGVSPSSGHSGILQVFNKRKSTVSEKIGDTLKLDTFVDRKFPDDKDSASIFSKVIGCELSHGSISDLYSRCQMDFASNVVQTETKYFVELGLQAVNTSNDIGILGTSLTGDEAHSSRKCTRFYKNSSFTLSR